MSDNNMTNTSASNCPPLPDNPATPELPKPPDCPPKCCCPSTPATTTETCLDDLIAEQAQQIAEAASATALKADLQDFLTKANTAQQEYTVTKYQELRDRWDKLDKDIADLITKLICCVPCWFCVLECEICTRLYAIRNMDLRLNGDGASLTDKVYSLRDLRCWQERNRDYDQVRLDRIKAVLAAWEKPAQTIDKILADNAKLVDDTKNILGQDPATAVYDVFMILVPLHLAIAPRGVTSKIDSQYAQLCDCDKGTPDDCCGPDVGPLPLRLQILGPQPYLVDPAKFFDIICCLVKQRYIPAKQLLAAAQWALDQTISEIDRLNTDIAAKTTSLAADFKASLGTTIDCDNYKPKAGNASQQNPPCKA